MTPILLDNFFPTDLYNSLKAVAQLSPMTYGSRSNRSTDPHGHWSWKPLHDKSQNLADLTDELSGYGSPLHEGWKFLRGGPCQGMKLLRCYVNGYTYGTDGYFHTDSERADELTVITYICDTWARDWAGETVCDNGKTYWSYLPRPNRTVIIPSNMLHAARAVSRKCPELRTTLMYKCRPARTPIFEKQSAWLRQVGALKLDHRDGSLHDHLMRCHQLIQDKGWDQPTRLCLAAGLHSIYGTNAFTEALLEPNDSNRAWVADLFGKEAEELAYLFHLLDRPKTLNDVKMGEGDCFLEYRYRAFGWHNAATTRALQLIECANLADQDSLGNWPNLRSLWDRDQIVTKMETKDAATPQHVRVPVADPDPDQ